MFLDQLYHTMTCSPKKFSCENLEIDIVKSKKAKFQEEGLENASFHFRSENNILFCVTTHSCSLFVSVGKRHECCYIVF